MGTLGARVLDFVEIAKGVAVRREPVGLRRLADVTPTTTQPVTSTHVRRPLDLVVGQEGDEAVDRGILGDELLVHAVVDHYRMRCRGSGWSALRASRTFHQKTLWPQFEALCDELDGHLEDLTTRVIREAINDDVSEPAEQPATKAPRRMPAEATDRRAPNVTPPRHGQAACPTSSCLKCVPIVPSCSAAA